MNSSTLTTHEERLDFVQESIDRARELRKKKEYKEAISLLVDALQYGLEKATIYYHLGNVYIDGEDLARAEYAYNRALEMDPNHINAMHNLAIVYRKQKKMSLYVKTFKKSQRLSLKRPHKTDFSKSERRKLRGLSGRVFVFILGGFGLVFLVIWLFTK